jgi:hypothetical protein
MRSEGSGRGVGIGSTDIVEFMVRRLDYIVKVPYKFT